MDLLSAIDTSHSGLKAQAARIKIVAENLANAESGPAEPGSEPYRRKNISFKTVLDKETGASKVAIAGIKKDQSEFRILFQPGHPAADENGYVRLPNVNSLVEMADLREAQRSYEANLSAIETSRSMMRSTLDLLR